MFPDLVQRGVKVLDGRSVQRWREVSLARDEVALMPPSTRAGAEYETTTHTLPRVQIDLVALIVDEYDPAIAFFTGILGFDLVEDSPSLTNDGRTKR